VARAGGVRRGGEALRDGKGRRGTARPTICWEGSGTQAYVRIWGGTQREPVSAARVEPQRAQAQWINWDSMPLGLEGWIHWIGMEWQAYHLWCFVARRKRSPVAGQIDVEKSFDPLLLKKKIWLFFSIPKMGSVFDQTYFISATSSSSPPVMVSGSEGLNSKTIK
jgi:hypothetical protein